MDVKCYLKCKACGELKLSTQVNCTNCQLIINKGINGGLPYAKNATIAIYGGSYTGELLNDKPYGQGILTFSGGTIYIGSWRDGKPNGKGKISYSNGGIYEGDFRDGKRHGLGKYCSPDGRQLAGEWKDGKYLKPIGSDLPYVKNATIVIYGGTYTGELLNNKPYGQGILTYSGGNKYIGSWRDGKPNGKGKVTYSNGGIYEGDFQSGKRHGLGKYCSPDGRQLEGEWANGEFLRPIVIIPEIKEYQEEKHAERNKEVQLKPNVNSDNEKGSDFVTASPKSKSNSISSKKTPLSAEIISILIWRCPICDEEESLNAEAMDKVVRCKACNAKWNELSEEAMVLVEGPQELLGEKPIQEWVELAHCDYITASTNKDITTSILLKKGELPIKKAVSASLFQEKTSKVRTSSGQYGGVSVPVFRTRSGPIRFHTGLFRTPATYETNTEIKLMDEGECLLTNKRFIFNGRSKPVNLILRNIISVDLAEGFVKMHYGQKTHFFRFGEESILKWSAYIKGACQEYGG